MARRPEIPATAPLSTAILVSHRDPGDPSVAELEQLLHGLGISVADRVVQRQRGRSPAFLGAGKLAELASLVEARRETHGELIVAVDAPLQPGQLHRLEAAVGVPVIDRTGVILRVFEERAQTPIARLEIELARLAYEAPRLRENEIVAARQGGGGGRGGRGHTSVELERRRIRARVAALRRQLAVHTDRDAEQRNRRAFRRVALVGYTNAGKSTLMRALTGADVLVADQLFATLGSTVRALAPPATPPVVVADTVGFIRNLPHDLVASFRSTLAEARGAELLLHVVDASDPSWEEQMRVTRSSVEAIGAGDVQELVVFNKADRIDDAARRERLRSEPCGVLVSARDGGDVARLRERIVSALDRSLVGEVLEVPSGDGRILAEIRSRGRIVAEAPAPDALRLAVRALPVDLERWRHLAPDLPQAGSVDDLLAAAGRQGLSLRAESATLDESGLDYRVANARDEEGRAWILRSPRRREVYASSLVEARVLALVREHLPVEVPLWQLHTPELIAYQRLEGIPAVTVDPDAGPLWSVIRPGAIPDTFLDSFASMLAALQSIPPDPVLPSRSIDEVRIEYLQAIEETRDALRPPERLRARWLRWLDDDRCWPAHVALVHGDLHPGHMLLGPDGRLRGVLDWTEAQVTDPSIDFAMAHGCFGAPVLRRLVERFERAGGRTWQGLEHHAAERWAAFPVLAAVWALRTGNEAVLAYARSELAEA